MSANGRATRHAALAVACAAFLCLSPGCSLSAAPFSLEGPRGALRLRALSREARADSLSPGSTAWYALRDSGPSLAGYSLELDLALLPGDSSASVDSPALGDSPSPGEVTLSAVYAADITEGTSLVPNPAPRPACKVRVPGGVSSGTYSFSVALELAHREGLGAARGFALGYAGGEGSSLSVRAARLVAPRWGFDRRPGRAWFGSSSEGGFFDATSQESLVRMPLAIPEGSLARLTLAPTPQAILGNPRAPRRIRFSSPHSAFGFRASPVPHEATVPQSLAGNGAFSLDASSDSASLLSAVVERGVPLPADRPADSRSPVAGDPHQILRWPQGLWRDSRREVFYWDRFPSILIFDTADYAVQDRYFKRLAFFTEKTGFRGSLPDDESIAGLHGFNAHDYRAESLAAFFEKARADSFPLLPEELELLEILIERGIVLKEGSRLVAGAGAVLSVSRESVEYLRHLFMTHECYHGAYFVDAAFRDKVTEVRSSLDARALEFLEGYFSIVPGLEYDRNDRYLMENEFMAYVMQQPIDRVSEYVSAILRERYIRHGGDEEIARYIEETKAADFVRAAEALEAYVFLRWGFACGRVGLWF